MTNNATASVATDVNDSGASRQGPVLAPAQTRSISDPTEVANLVLWHIDAVNDRQSEQMTAIKALTDLMKQLLRAYAEHSQIIRRQEARIRELEAMTAPQRSTADSN